MSQQRRDNSETERAGIRQEPLVDLISLCLPPCVMPGKPDVRVRLHADTQTAARRGIVNAPSLSVHRAGNSVGMKRETEGASERKRKPY